jgi:hypothetical protein
MKIRSVEAEVLHSGGRRDERWTLVVAFRNFTKATKKKRNLTCVGNFVS